MKSVKGISLAALTLLFALSTVGLTYSMWSESLSITGTIETGYLSGIWVVAANFDPPPPDSTGDPSHPNILPRTKDVGYTSVEGLGTDTLIITVHNGYPCYYNDLQVEFDYTGSVPVHIVDIIVEPIGGWTLASAYGADDGEMWVDFVDGIGSQLHQGDTAAASFKIHVEQPAKQDSTYAFTVKIVLVQWNEADQYVP